jgi:hypothetical protein
VDETHRQISSTDTQLQDISWLFREHCPNDKDVVGAVDRDVVAVIEPQHKIKEWGERVVIVPVQCCGRGDFAQYYESLIPQGAVPQGITKFEQQPHYRHRNVGFREPL